MSAWNDYLEILEQCGEYCSILGKKENDQLAFDVGVNDDDEE